MNKLLFSLVVCALVLFTGCSDDDDDASPKVKVTISEVTSTSMKVSWDAIADADSYDVEYKEEGVSDELWKTTTTTSYELTGLKASTKYEVVVVAMKEVSDVESREIAISSIEEVTTAAAVAADKE